MNAREPDLLDIGVADLGPERRLEARPHLVHRDRVAGRPYGRAEGGVVERVVVQLVEQTQQRHVARNAKGTDGVPDADETNRNGLSPGLRKRYPAASQSSRRSERRRYPNWNTRSI